MFKVYKSITAGQWEKLKEFSTFNDAHEFASKEVCVDVYHEGGKDSVYWFSDENSPDAPYKVVIDAVNFLKG